MWRLLLCGVVLIIVSTAEAEKAKIPISVSRMGDDAAGALFADALTQEISHSTVYRPMANGIENQGVRYYIELVTLAVSGQTQASDRKSVISVVIQQMGQPNSFPVAELWYHKAFVVTRSTTSSFAKELIKDMGATYCNVIKNSVGNCPPEKLDPKLNSSP